MNAPISFLVVAITLGSGCAESNTQARPATTAVTSTVTTTRTTTVTPAKPLAAAPASALPYSASTYHVPKRGAADAGQMPPVGSNVAAGAVAEALVRKQSDDLRACYERGLVRNAQLAGNVMLSFYYMPAGQISQPTTEGSTLTESDVLACLTDTVVRIDFPTFTGQAVKVSIPIDFTSSK